MGLARRATGDTEGAIRHFRSATGIRPDYAQAQNDLGVTLMGQGRFAEAGVRFEKAIEARPEFLLPQVNLGHVRLREGRTEEAERLLTNAAANGFPMDELHHGIGLSLVDLGRDNDAIVHFNEVLRAYESVQTDTGSSPNPRQHAEILLNVAGISRRAGRPTEAIRALREALVLLPGNAVILTDLARATAEARDIGMAATYYQEALRSDPNHLPALIDLTKIYLHASAHALQRPRQALVLARRAVELTEHRQIESLDLLAVASARNEAFGEAADAARQALQLAKRLPGAAELCAQFQRRLEAYQENRLPAAEP
jgi:tetratricopeptide (TPR) repeat protein